MPEITEDDRAKRVVDDEGEAIGIVAEVKEGTAYVDPDPNIDTEVKSTLGWGDDERTTYPLRNDVIEEVTDDEIRLVTDY